MDEAVLGRFMAKVAVDPESGCWLWTGATSGGYGRLRVKGETVQAHRLSYEHFVGPIPAGLELDHVRARGCRSRSCVSPFHLEAVTRRENMLRSDSVSGQNARKTHCPANHPFDEANTYVRKDYRSRDCRACRAAAVVRRRERLRG